MVRVESAKESVKPREDEHAVRRAQGGARASLGEAPTRPPMPVAVLSDVHANLEALETVLEEAAHRGAEHVVCLGDIVGYGPDPAACVALVRERCAAVVAGNHDRAVATGEDVEVLPRDGQEAAYFHREVLDAADLAWLEALPLRAEAFGATLVHAAPSDPAAWLRLESMTAVQAQFGAFDTPICFVGHSHRPAVVSDRIGVLRVRPGHRFLVDVGSVGQPRDHDPRASFALFDADAFTVEIVRVHYDVERTILKVEHAGLPPGLGARLRRGI